MKTALTALGLSAALSVCASVKIQEEVYVMGLGPESVKEIVTSGSAIVDHVSSRGFELYGGAGLKAYLNAKGIPYVDMVEISEKVFADYPDHAQITATLKAAAAKYSHIMKLESIGKSNQGRELWVMKISDNVGADEVEPEFKYISSMHGDEITGRELTTALIQDIGEGYGQDERITNLVNSTEIYIMPSMNPDGSAARRRANARGVDLNRNFPDIISDTTNSTSGREIENKHVMKFQASRKFALSANFHGGSLVVNYPWDSKYELHPLDDLARELSLAYAVHNPQMHASPEFDRGITNGAQWYVVRGGMQDWSYFWHNDLQITLEVSDIKWPDYSDIPSFYESNKESMLNYLSQIHQGAGVKFNVPEVQGLVVVRQLTPLKRDLGQFAFTDSEFYKVLPKGTYSYEVHTSEKVSRIEVETNGTYTVVE